MRKITIELDDSRFDDRFDDMSTDEMSAFVLEMIQHQLWCLTDPWVRISSIHVDAAKVDDDTVNMMAAA